MQRFDCTYKPWVEVEVEIEVEVEVEVEVSPWTKSVLTSIALRLGCTRKMALFGPRRERAPCLVVRWAGRRLAPSSITSSILCRGYNVDTFKLEHCMQPTISTMLLHLTEHANTHPRLSGIRVLKVLPTSSQTYMNDAFDVSASRYNGVYHAVSSLTFAAGLKSNSPVISFVHRISEGVPDQ